MTPDLDPHIDPTPRPAPYGLPPAGRPDYYRDPRYKSPVLATVLSLMPGLGQVYLGYTRLGFIHGLAMATFIALMSSNKLGMLEPFFGVSMAFFVLYNLVDAHRRATLLNEAIARMETPDLPDGFGAVSFNARIGLGLGLILLGGMSLLSIWFQFSFAWLEHWWPVGLLGFGVYLVVKALKDRAAQSDASQN